MRLQIQTSLTLDSLRILAAMSVFGRHLLDIWFPDSIHPPNQPGDIAHAAVILFFTLSGFVISYTTTSGSQEKSYYFINRVARLVSVVWPALLLCAGVEILLHLSSDSVLLNNYSRDLPLARYIITALFLNELWFLSAAPPINRPLWSLGFEFWYYTIFGLWYFSGSGKWQKLPMLLACIVAGPKILLMLPIWVFGVMAYSVPAMEINNSIRWIIFAGSTTIAAILLFYLPPFPYFIGERPLYFANQFITDWIIGLFFALSLWILPPRIATGHNRELGRTGRGIRALADLTFAIYVLHQPLTVLFCTIFGLRKYDASQFGIATAAVLFTAIGFGILLEQSRKRWLNLLIKLHETIRRGDQSRT